MLTTLRSHFGFSAFRPGQAEAIQNLLAGQHTLVVMPTGAGKSLIYQLAALHRPGVTLIISPLIALMKDQVDTLNRRNIPATFINSALTSNEQARRLQAMAQNAFRLVYIAPERLRSVPFMQALRQITIGLLAVDEAHCLSQWGHDFRPDYLHIATALEQVGAPPVVALTATATPQVQDDIVRLLRLASAQRITTGFNRANLSFEVHYTSNPSAKLQALKDLLDDLEDGRAIIYVGTRRDAEEVAEFVRSVCETDAEHYHAGLDAETRANIQDRFLKGDLTVAVATNAFGMGIDRPDVRLVAHFNLPGTLEAYYQEAGRAGRDGEVARAVLLYDPRDRALQEWFIENDTPTPEEVRALYQAIQQAGHPEIWMTYSDLSLSAELHEVMVKVGLAQLELAGIIHRLGDEGQRMLLRVNTWNEKAVREVSTDVETRRRHRRAQLAKMVDYAESNACRRRMLLDHFGDRAPAEAPRCCDNCLAKPAVSATLQRGNFAKLSQAGQTALIILDAVRRLDWEIGREKLAQMLWGSKAKEMKKFGYDHSPYYGRLRAFSLKVIEQMIEQLVKQGHFKVIGGNRPVLRLTPQGQTAVKERAGIDLPGVNPTEQPARKRTQRVVQLGEARSSSAVPELIAALEDIDGNVRRLAASALGKIGDQRAVKPLLKMLEHEEKPQVRQYAVKALGRLRDPRVRQLLEKIAANQAEREYTQTAARFALKRLTSNSKSDIADFLSRSHPRPLSGPWHDGWALGFHSSFSGDEWRRSAIGELAYRLKYQSDFSVLPQIVKHAAALCTEHPELNNVDAIIPVPPSTSRTTDPVRKLAEALGRQLKRPVRNILTKTRHTAPQKEMKTRAQKLANVAGAFAVQDKVRDQRLLVVDDLYDSGATLEEVTRVLLRAGAARVCVLTLTRTIHTDA